MTMDEIFTKTRPKAEAAFWAVFKARGYEPKDLQNPPEGADTEHWIASKEAAFRALDAKATALFCYFEIENCQERK